MNESIPPLPSDPTRGTVPVIDSLDIGAAQGFGAPEPHAPLPSKSSLKSQEEKQAEQITEDNNPAESHEARMLRERGPRLSLNAPTRRLEVPPLPGFHLHWFLERNIRKALAGWYEFVTPEEVPTVDRTIGGRTQGNTSEDLGGSRVTQIAGVAEDGRPEQLVLMKIRQEWFFDEQRKIAERNLSIVQQIFHKKAPLKMPEEAQKDYEMRYTREALLDMSAGRFRKVE